MSTENIQEEIIALEKHALDLWFAGKTEGYRNLWSKTNFSYVDGAQLHRVDDRSEVDAFLDNLEGALHADSYRFERPRVQVIAEDAALLTYELYADTNLINMQYNCIELFKKEAGEWKVIHSTWSFIQPMNMDFGKAKEIV